jgi:hypothetical protein
MTTTAKRLDHHPRAVRRAKPKPATLDDDTEARLRMNERDYRASLWLDFARFARKHGGIVISRPSASPVCVLVPVGDGEESPFEIAMRSKPKYPVTKSLGTMVRLSNLGLFETMRPVEVRLWP